MPRLTTSDDITLEYEVHGSGEPLLLITGLSGQLTDWHDGFIELLNGEGFQVIRFDNRDSGLSTKLSHARVSPARLLGSMITRRRPAAPYVIEDMAGDARALLDGLGLDAVHVVGASMGGMIAQALAIDHPTRVRSMTSIMSHTGDRRNGRISARLLLRLPVLGRMNESNAVTKGIQMAEALAGPSFDPTEARDRVSRAVERCFDPKAGERQAHALFASRDRTPFLHRLHLPTVVIHGRRDPLVAPSGGRATAAAIAGARLIEFDDMGHELPRHRWNEIVAAIRQNAERALSPRSVLSSV